MSAPRASGAYAPARQLAQQGGKGTARPDASGLGPAQVTAWVEDRNVVRTDIDGPFRMADARGISKKLYPTMATYEKTGRIWSLGLWLQANSHPAYRTPWGKYLCINSEKGMCKAARKPEHSLLSALYRPTTDKGGAYERPYVGRLEILTRRIDPSAIKVAVLTRAGQGGPPDPVASSPGQSLPIIGCPSFQSPYGCRIWTAAARCQCLARSKAVCPQSSRTWGSMPWASRIRTTSTLAPAPAAICKGV